MVGAPRCCSACGDRFFVSLAVKAPALTQEAMAMLVDAEPLVAVTTKGEVTFRKDFAHDYGMLLVFEQDQPVDFWVKNMPLLLDLVFLGPTVRYLMCCRVCRFSRLLSRLTS